MTEGKEVCAPSCTDPEAVMVSGQSEDLAPSIQSIRPEHPRALASPCHSSAEGMAGGCVRARLERHRREMAGRVRVPEAWGQEDSLQSCVDCSAFERFLPEGLALARAALVEDCRRGSPRQLADNLRQTSAGRMGIENRC